MYLSRFFHFTTLFYKLLLCLLVFSSLFKGNWFVNVFYSPLFAFIGVGCWVVLIAALQLWQKKQFTLSPVAATALVLIIGWAIYVYLNDCFNSTAGMGGTLPSLYYVVSMVVCLAIACCADSQGRLWRVLFVALLAVAALQAVYCLLQWVGGIGANNDGFTVTGTWVNPNIAAIYLALALPLVWYPVLVKGRWRKAYIVILLLILLALLMLKSRSGLIGAIIGTGMMLEWRYGKIKQLLTGGNRRSIALVLLLLMLLAGTAAALLYHVKQASSDSRWFIWKRSAQMIAQKPWLGYGYGSFERNYNLYQAQYFAAEGGTDKERNNAAHTKMAYNGLLQTVVEGGLIGLGFLMAIVCVLLLGAYRYLKKHQLFYYQPANPARAVDYVVVATVGLLVLCCMSLINFTLLAVPIMSVTVVYVAYLLHAAACLGPTKRLGKKATSAMALAFILIALWLGVRCMKQTAQQLGIRQAADDAVIKQYAVALDALPSHADNGSLADYWFTVANIQYFNNNKAAAAMAYEKAAQWVSTPELYQQWGNSCLALGQHQAAMEHYLTAQHIQPNRFTPRYLLLMLYVQMKDSANAERVANDMVRMEVKVPSPTIEKYKRVAKQLLQQIKTNR